MSAECFAPQRESVTIPSRVCSGAAGDEGTGLDAAAGDDEEDELVACPDAARALSATAPAPRLAIKRARPHAIAEPRATISIQKRFVFMVGTYPEYQQLACQRGDPPAAPKSLIKRQQGVSS